MTILLKKMKFLQISPLCHRDWLLGKKINNIVYLIFEQNAKYTSNNLIFIYFFSKTQVTETKEMQML